MDQSGTDGSPASDETTTVTDQGPPITEFRKNVNTVWCDFESEKSFRLTLVAPASKICFELNAVGKYRPDGTGSEIKWKISETNKDVDEKITDENFVGGVSRCSSFDEPEYDAHVKFYAKDFNKVGFTILNSFKLAFIIWGLHGELEFNIWRVGDCQKG